MELVAQSLSLNHEKEGHKTAHRKKGGEKPQQFRLHPTSLSASTGEIIGLIGPNGAGKSTLLKLLAGILPPVTGRVMFGGQELRNMTPLQRGRILAYLPQNGPVPYGFTVEDVISLGRLPYQLSPDLPEERTRRASMLEECALSPLARRRIETLSGGEKARVFLARALITKAPFLLVDEPVAALDPAHSLSIMRILHHYAIDPGQKEGAGEAAQQKGAVIVVLHDLALAARFCTRLVLLHKGRILADAPPRDVLTPGLLAQAFGVTMRFWEDGSQRIPLPWAVLPQRVL